MEPTTLTSLSGSLMSLFGLLVSLFSVHLGNWLSKLQGLRTRWDINSGSDDREVATRRECSTAMPTSDEVEAVLAEVSHVSV